MTKILDYIALAVENARRAMRDERKANSVPLRNLDYIPNHILIAWRKEAQAALDVMCAALLSDEVIEAVFLKEAYTPPMADVRVKYRNILTAAITRLKEGG